MSSFLQVQAGKILLAMKEICWVIFVNSNQYEGEICSETEPDSFYSSKIDIAPNSTSQLHLWFEN